MLSGSLSNTVLSHCIMYPAIKPASKAPRNPLPPCSARNPPVKPAASAGLSEILIAMYPLNTGSIKLNAAPPAVLKNAAKGVFIPKFDGSME